MFSVLLFGVAAALASTQQQQTDTSFAVSARTEIRLDAQGGNVSVRAGEDGRLRVRAMHSPATRVRIRQQENAVRIDASSNRGDARDMGWEIFVPASNRIRIEGVDLTVNIQGLTADAVVSTVNGNITVNGARNVDLTSLQGNIVVTGARGRVVASALNDAIRITDVEGEIKAEAVNNAVILTRINATRVEASSINNRVQFDGVLRANGIYNLSSHNGDVVVSVPANTNASVTLSTQSGSFESDFPVQVQGNLTGRGGSFSFTLGAGGPKLDLSSFNGTIRIRRNDGRT
jgi:DUF4097 and DUF4098 domain-containing protein YvlB